MIIITLDDAKYGRIYLRMSTWGNDYYNTWRRKVQYASCKNFKNIFFKSMREQQSLESAMYYRDDPIAGDAVHQSVSTNLGGFLRALSIKTGKIKSVTTPIYVDVFQSPGYFPDTVPDLVSCGYLWQNQNYAFYKNQVISWKQELSLLLRVYKFQDFKWQGWLKQWQLTMKAAKFWVLLTRKEWHYSIKASIHFKFRTKSFSQIFSQKASFCSF